MSKPGPGEPQGQTETSIPLSSISIRHRPRHRYAVIGNPNSGKSTLFNRLTGLRQTTGNYPGVTVERHTGTVELKGTAAELIDLPGIYALGGQSTDERIAVDALLGRIDSKPDGLLVVVDATHLYQGLYLLEQLIELQLPMLVALTMSDMARAGGIAIDTDLLSRHLGGIAVVEVTATTGLGVSDLKSELATLHEAPVPVIGQSWPELSQLAQQLADQCGNLDRMDVIQALLLPGGAHDQLASAAMGPDVIPGARNELFGSEPPQAVEARQRYRWAREVRSAVQHEAPLLERFGAKVLAWVNRPWPATALFFLSLVLVFQAVFSWATPLMDAIDAGAAGLGAWVTASLGNGVVASFLADGIIAGVGSVIIFLPQILILFLFIIILEDTGYLARAAFLMDSAMRRVGLSGQSVIPMLSSFACAVPAIMATRVIPDRRDRISTILASPFMTCSARLPIYALLIAAFVPNQSVGWFNLQGLVLFGLYLLGIAGGLMTARLMKSTALRGPKPHFMLALPDFRRPNLQTVMIKLMDRARIFLKRAGTVIFSVAVIVWALAYFPRMDTEAPLPEPVNGQSLENQRAAAQMSQSYLGRIGKVVEPVFEPLGWDWKVSSAVIAGFPAREVVVAVMGTLYAVGSEADEGSLTQKLRAATWPDGRAIFTLPMVLGLMVFYAWCLQCAATVAVIRRETNSWRWPLFAWTYMSAVAYLGAFAVFQVGSLLTGPA
ncbi:MAG: ferrous iron transport protein B [Xanthomonadales bacterium]|nr:ferrous iron transport protein B [Xanthomonadales bacterium]